MDKITNTTHGLSHTSEYNTWSNMKGRCHNPNDQSYFRYGARGITVCDRWFNSFENFIHDMGSRPHPKYELDRINNDKGYSPDNCRWVSVKENSLNRRSNRHITANGETLTISQWCERLDVHPTTIHRRLKIGWTEQEAVTIKKGVRKIPRRHNFKTL